MLCAAPNILVQLSTITYTYNKCTEVSNWRQHWLRRLREQKVYSPSFFSIQWCRTLLANAHWVLWPLYSWGVHRTLTSCIITLFPVRFHRERAGSYFSVSLRDYIHDLYLHTLLRLTFEEWLFSFPQVESSYIISHSRARISLSVHAWILKLIFTKMERGEKSKCWRACIYILYTGSSGICLDMGCRPGRQRESFA